MLLLLVMTMEAAWVPPLVEEPSAREPSPVLVRLPLLLLPHHVLDVIAPVIRSTLLLVAQDLVGLRDVLEAHLKVLCLLAVLSPVVQWSVVVGVSGCQWVSVRVSGCQCVLVAAGACR